MPLTELEIVETWNDKQKAGSLRLSGLVPFINLIALLTEDEMAPIKDEQFIRRLINYKIINDDGGTFTDGHADISSSIKGIPIGNPESQLGTIRQSGGIGLNSLNIVRGTKESFNINYDLSLTITEVEEFDRKRELTQLITLNSNFIIMYGWSGSSGLFVNPPDVFKQSDKPEDGGNVVIDMKAGKGYWKAIPASLYKFEYDFDESGYINARIGFLSPHNAALTFLKMSSIRNNITGLLFDNKRSSITIEGDVADPSIEAFITGKSHEALSTPKGILSIRPVVAANTGINLIYEELSIKPGEIKIIDEDDGNGSDPWEGDDDFSILMRRATRRYAAAIAALNTTGAQYLMSKAGGEHSPQAVLQQRGIGIGANGAIAALNTTGAKYLMSKAGGEHSPQAVLQQMATTASAADNEDNRNSSAQDMNSSNTHSSDEEGRQRIEREPDVQVRETKTSLRYFYLGWVIEAIRQSMKDRNEGKNRHTVPTFSYQFFGDDETINSVYNKFYIPTNSEPENSNAQLKRLDSSDRIVSVFEIPIHIDAVTRICDSAIDNLSMLDAIRSLLSPDSIALVGLQLGIRNKNNKLEIFAISVTEGDLEQEIGIKEVNDLDITNAVSVTFGYPGSLCENIAMSSHLDPEAYITYKMQVDVGGGTIENLITNKKLPPSVQSDLRSLYNELTDDIKKNNERIEKELDAAREAGTYKDIPASALAKGGSFYKTNIETRYTSQTFISLYISQDARNYAIISRAFLDDKDIFAALLGMYLRRTTLTLHGTTDINAYESILIRGLVRRMEGIYTIIQVTDQINQNGFQTILECVMRKPLRDIPIQVT